MPVTNRPGRTNGGERHDVARRVAVAGGPGDRVNGRRTFVRCLALGIVATPLLAQAQSAGKVPRVGVLMPTAPPPAPNPGLAAFRQGLRELGYVEGQNVRLEIRWQEGASGRRAALVLELVRVPVDVLVV